MKNNLKRVNFSDPEKYNKLVTHLKENGKPGLDNPFYCMQEHYTHKQSGITDWTGFAAAGKTYFVLEFLMSLSEKHRLRHGLYLPDLGTYYEVMEKLVKMHTGKDFTDKYRNKITERELNNARVFIDYHFIILIKENVRVSLTPEQYWEYICDYKDEDGGLDTCLIDSWKNITQEGSERNRDLYLDRVLSYRNELAETYNKHFHTIAHPVKTEIEVNKGAKNRRVPNMYDIKGGGAWAANGKNVIIIDRPDRKDTGIDVFINKTKPENVGKEGSIVGRMYLDLARGRYYEFHQNRKYYAYQWEGKEHEMSIDPKDMQAIEYERAKSNAKESMEQKLNLPLENPFTDDSNPDIF